MIVLSFTLVSGAFAQWAPVVNISPNSLAAIMNENMGPCLAVNGDSLHVVWSDRHAAGSAIYYRHSLDTGLTWSRAIPITDTTGKASFPVVAVSGANVHVVWMDSLNGNRASRYTHSLDGGMTWGPVVTLDTNTAFWPGVAVSGSTVLVSLDKRLSATNTEVFFLRSLDNGTNWSSETQISNAPGRSEDQAMAVLGNDVHLSWNDNRNGPMEIYYIHSKDLGVTWGLEAQITATDSYTTMVSLFGSNVDVVYANRSTGNFDLGIRQSPDTGSSFGAARPISSDPGAEAYPYMARDGLNLYLVYRFGVGAWYINSTDGGATWSVPYNLGAGGQPYISYTGTVLHAVWTSAGHVNYLRSPNGNPTGIGRPMQSESLRKKVTIFQTPDLKQINIEATTVPESIELCDMAGRTVRSVKPGFRSSRISTSGLAQGLYFLRVGSRDDTSTIKIPVAGR